MDYSNLDVRRFRLNSDLHNSDVSRLHTDLQCHRMPLALIQNAGNPWLNFVLSIRSQHVLLDVTSSRLPAVN